MVNCGRRRWFVFLLAAVTPGVAAAQTFTDSLAGSLNPSYWSITETTGGLYSISTGAGSVQIAKTGTTPGGLQNAGLSLNLAAFGGPVSGDFSTSISFQNAVINGGGFDQIEFHATFQDASIFFAVRDDVSAGQNVHVWTGSNLGGPSYSGTSGTFTISRTGTTVSAFINGSTLIASTANASPLSAIAFVLQNNLGSNDATSVEFTNFSLTPAAIPEPSQTALTMAILLCGMALWRRAGNRDTLCS